VEAFDFDPEAIRVARANARRNGVLDKIRLRRADLTGLPSRSKRRYDVVCANLISTLLKAERGRIRQRLKAGGVLVLAGILASEFPKLQRLYVRQGLRPATGSVDREWRSGAFLS
jgi:ribosomal protein L11 methyltransferase